MLSPSWCGNYDTADFDSNAMCCACGGGSTGAESDGNNDYTTTRNGIKTNLMKRFAANEVYDLFVMSQFGMLDNNSRTFNFVTSTSETSIALAVVEGTEYTYGVSAVNAAGESEMSLVTATGAGPSLWDGAVAPEVTAEGYTSDAGLAGVLWTWEDSNVEALECDEGVSSYIDCLGTPFCNDDVLYVGYDCIVNDGTCTDVDGNGSIVSWVGDGLCDDYTEWALNLDCADYSFDCGDCATADEPWDEQDANGYCDDLPVPVDTCADDYCPDGEYWDGLQCYSCSYCLETSDDSACGAETGNDCCGACGGSANPNAACNEDDSAGGGDTGGGDADIAYHAKLASHASLTGLRTIDNMIDLNVINVQTGEGTNNDSRLVSYLVSVSCDDCLDDGAGGTSPLTADYTSNVNGLALEGFIDGSVVCATVTVINGSGELSPASALECAAAGAVACDDVDEDGICDDEDPCVGQFDDCGVCNGDGSSCIGDANQDGTTNVLDIIVIVDAILSNGDVANADANADGTINVLDIIVIVDIILGGDARSADATSATMNIANDTVSISGNGFIGAIQMTLSHGAGFSIDLTDDAMVADYRTSGNTTTLIVVAPNSDEIFTASGDFTVEETLVASGNGYVPLSTPASFTLSAAYPNPFNPSTSLDMTMPSEGYVSIQAYNLVGQVVGTIAEGNMSAGTHSFAWDASDLSSGVYLIKAEYAGNVETQKVMLLK